MVSVGRRERGTETMPKSLRINLHPFPIFNMGREDLVQTVLLFVFTTMIVMVVRSSQGQEPNGYSYWKGVVVVTGTIFAFIFFLLALVKMCCGYNPDEAFYYQELEAGNKADKHVTVVEAGPVEERYNDTAEYEPAENRQSRGGYAAYDAERQSRSYDAEAAAPRATSTAALEKYSGYRSLDAGRYTPKDEDDVSCGIEVEQAPADFEHHGVLHNKGTYRIRRVEERGVCERQGVCKPGDILVHINGVPVAGMPLSKVHSRLRGKASSKVYLGLILEGSRAVTERAVVLAHFPALQSSPRGTSASYQSGVRV